MVRLCSSVLSLFLYRLASVLIVKTSYVPDEYWQCLEVAHRMVFGYGYLTWEWQNGLRSCLYPSFFAFFYEILKRLNLDFPWLLITLPKLLQAFITAFSDRCFILLCKDLEYQNYWARVVLLTNWFWYYCGFRTITNTFETSLSIIALYYYPWNILIKEKIKILFFEIDVRPRSIVYITLATIICIIRPASATIWGPLILFQMYSLTSKYNYLFFKTCLLPVALTVLPASILIDSFYYNKFTFPPYNFFMINIYEGISSFYGTHPYQWYITQAFPVILGIHYLPFIVGVFVFFKKQITRENCLYRKVYGIFFFILGFNLLILSNIPHKEFRFALPLTPVMMLFVVATLSNYQITSNKNFKIFWTTVSILGFLLPTVLFGIFHQSGTLPVMGYLRDKIDKCQPNCYFLFLMPCHSTPLYSHLHANVTTKFLTCNPPLDNNYYDEAEEFFKNPDQWLQKNWGVKQKPSHVILFDSIQISIGKFLADRGYIKAKEFFHTFLPEQRTGRYILIYELSLNRTSKSWLRKSSLMNR